MEKITKIREDTNMNLESNLEVLDELELERINAGCNGSLIWIGSGNVIKVTVPTNVTVPVNVIVTVPTNVIVPTNINVKVPTCVNVSTILHHFKLF